MRSNYVLVYVNALGHVRIVHYDDFELLMSAYEGMKPLVKSIFWKEIV